MTTLASLQQALTENYEQLQDLLARKSYVDALSCMDYRISLIDRLLYLVESEPSLKQDATVLATLLFRQEESMKKVASDHHQLIFNELSAIGLASKAKRIYSANRKEF
ncbi:hypothetical protein ACUVMQ_03335 [Aeromonas veronii]|uniref:hypothetical protein n=1 Tax=Aeromonas veronii TaxID=654 RepID=UPI001FD1433B|nr:hypothetical protein [Aeromonas veronii]MCJ7974228.1 hypothetical protein [Aeromonas veronii]UOR20612.1 hypothetical protein LOS88_08230 [Aeromonas veronii]